jgi:hypothetical protein
MTRLATAILEAVALSDSCNRLSSCNSSNMRFIVGKVSKFEYLAESLLRGQMALSPLRVRA